MQAQLVVVTGARPQVSTLLQQAGIKEEFRDDLRVTSKEALKVTLLCTLQDTCFLFCLTAEDQPRVAAMSKVRPASGAAEE